MTRLRACTGGSPNDFIGVNYWDGPHCRGRRQVLLFRFREDWGAWRAMACADGHGNKKALRGSAFSQGGRGDWKRRRAEKEVGNV